ncbi:MAG: lysophospholipid acyltransferase family protein [Candidatus Eisenbacteria bacterium]
MSGPARPKMSHRIEDAALRAALFLLGPLGWRGTQRLGAAAGSLAYRIVRKRRDVTAANISRAFPEKSGAEVDALVRETYRSWGRTFFEFARFGAMGPGEVRRLVRIDNCGILDEVLAEGKGAVLFTGHFGNFDLFGAAVVARGYPLSVLVQRQSNRIVDERMRRYRERMGARVIYRGPNAREIVRALREGRLVAIVGDQDAREAGVFVDFLGAPASTPKGPALFARRYGAPIIFCAGERQEDGTHVCRFEGPIRPDLAADEETEVMRLTSDLAGRLETAVRLRPDHYFWMHRRWKTKPPAAEGAAS